MVICISSSLLVIDMTSATSAATSAAPGLWSEDVYAGDAGDAGVGIYTYIPDWYFDIAAMMQLYGWWNTWRGVFIFCYNRAIVNSRSGD